MLNISLALALFFGAAARAQVFIDIHEVRLDSSRTLIYSGPAWTPENVVLDIERRTLLLMASNVERQMHKDIGASPHWLAWTLPLFSSWTAIAPKIVSENISVFAHIKMNGVLIAIGAGRFSESARPLTDVRVKVISNHFLSKTFDGKVGEDLLFARAGNRLTPHFSAGFNAKVRNFAMSSPYRIEFAFVDPLGKPQTLHISDKERAEIMSGCEEVVMGQAASMNR